MKAIELMIGDWVTMNGNPVRITRLTEFGEYQNIAPIQLTPEILEKNDIHETNKNHWFWERKPHTNTDIMYQAEEICFDKEFPRKENGGLHTGGFVRVASEHGMVYGECEYVHELQHALRLCKIEKIIVL